MPIIAVVILVHSRQDKARQDKTRKTIEDNTRWNIHRFVAYNDNNNDNNYNNVKYEIILSLEYDSSLTAFWSNMYES